MSVQAMFCQFQHFAIQRTFELCLVDGLWTQGGGQLSSYTFSKDYTGI